MMISSEQNNKLEKTLAIVVKADAAGTEEAVLSGIENLDTGDVKIEAVYSGIGDISKTDLLMAETAGRLIMGFDVDLLPGIKKLAAEKVVEIHLHNVIYEFLEDLGNIARAMTVREEPEIINGKAKIIALFKGGRKSIILGCEIYEGVLVKGASFRIISAPGIVYTGTIDSMHIDTREVKRAEAGQQVGIKIFGSKRAGKGDLIESFEKLPAEKSEWHPRGIIEDLRSG